MSTLSVCWCELLLLLLLMMMLLMMMSIYFSLALVFWPKFFYQAAAAAAAAARFFKCFRNFDIESSPNLISLPPNAQKRAHSRKSALKISGIRNKKKCSHAHCPHCSRLRNQTFAYSAVATFDCSSEESVAVIIYFVTHTNCLYLLLICYLIVFRRTLSVRLCVRA